MSITRISDAAVLKATGKNWAQWFAILDKAGAKTMKHIDIARMMQNKFLGKKNKTINVAKSEGWWAQMVTVQYEYARKKRPLPGKRVKQEMPEFVLRALEEEQLMEAYHERPPYQQNDYLSWINHGKQQATKDKRLKQMLEELRGGRIYMYTVWKKK